MPWVDHNSVCLIGEEGETDKERDSVAAFAQVRKELTGSDDSGSLTPEQTKERREALKAFLKKRDLSATEEADGRLVVAGSAFVRPPYRVADCICANEVVLDRIRDLVGAFHRDNVES